MFSTELLNFQTCAQIQILAANQNGYMTLGIDTDSASVTTHFRHLDTPTWGMYMVVGSDHAMKYFEMTPSQT